MSIIAAPVSLSTPAAASDDWSIRFDSAQARYRRSLRKPANVFGPADAGPVLASPIDGVGDMQDERFYEKFQHTRELADRRLAVVDRHLAEIAARLDARESFAEELVAAVAVRPRSKFHPSAEDRAWELGYSLGRDGIAAASYHATHAETMAFLAGHDRGLTAYHDDQRDEVEALIAAWEADHGREDREEHELAYAGSAVGHMA